MLFRFLYGYSLRGYSLYSYFISCMPLAAFFIFLNRGFGTFCTDFSVRGCLFSVFGTFLAARSFYMLAHFYQNFDLPFRNFLSRCDCEKFFDFVPVHSCPTRFVIFLRSFYRHFLKSATFFRNFFQWRVEVHPDYTCTVPTRWSELCSLYPNHSLIII